MPNYEDELVTKTHKQEGLETSKRVFYTLNDGKANMPHRTALLLSDLIQHLENKGVLSEEDIDSMLFHIVT